MLTGTWTALSHLAPANVASMLLLTDGSVVASGSYTYGGASKAWYKLAPDANSSYVNGSWSQLASMNLERLYPSTNVLKDGRLFVMGGKYIGPSNLTGTDNTGEIYNPVTNSWSSIASYPESIFGSAPSTLFPDGRVLTA